MAPIATSDATANAPSTEFAALAPLEAISCGPTLPGIPSFYILEEKRQWMYGVHFGMLKASDMILVNYHNGKIVGGNRSRPVNAAGVLIHAAIHKARPDVHAICHAHSIHGVSYSTFAKPLEMLNQDVCNIFGVQGVYSQYGGIVFGEGEGLKLAHALGPKGKGLILMNHGLLTVGKTCDEAGYLFRLMEKSCKIQLEVDAAAVNGLKKHIISDEEAAYNFKMASESEILYCEFQPELEYEEFLSGPGFRT
ncbi:hypothetical protein HO133_004619 [Letharia lupina]|uniref:Class II aldolase/adducin N-terminal domain-containing protein n=1 Tax=Letharia lupina TaxID=560253 RepID=A0A8H6KZT9_9LECA|nr:uncharacterized protein HO133_004619 [Letharia lupina]KAF6230279.1 hypothetical protein HO133_004619 [Letharia lupina]